MLWRNATGSELSSSGRPRWNSPPESSGLEGSRRPVPQLDGSITNSLRVSSSQCAEQLLSASSERVTGSQPDLPLPTSMSGRRTPEFQTRSLNSGPKPSEGIMQPIGPRSSSLPNPGTYPVSPPTSMYVIILPCRGKLL